jgi:hypothetical protein
MEKQKMDSINRQQPEHNRADLQGDQAVAKVREIVKQSATCFFCTAVSTGDSTPAGR